MMKQLDDLHFLFTADFVNISDIHVVNAFYNKYYIREFDSSRKFLFP